MRNKKKKKQNTVLLQMLIKPKQAKLNIKKQSKDFMKIQKAEKKLLNKTKNKSKRKKRKELSK